MSARGSMRQFLGEIVSLLFVAGAWLTLLHAGCAHVPALTPITRAQEFRIAERIHSNFEERLVGMSGTKGAHYATRLYRVTGDQKYMRPVVFKLLFDSERLLRDISHLSDPDYMRRRYDLYFDSMGEGTELKRSRKEFWEGWKREIFDQKLTGSMYRWQQYGLSGTRYQPYFDQALAYLRSGSIEEFYLNPDVIRNHPVKVVNGVYYLYFLGIADLRGELGAAFADIYINRMDNLSESEFEDMVYGLTHFVIAGSNYYQQFCSAEEYSWVLDVFREHVAEIAFKCTPDMIAEVGLCFMLCRVPREDIPYQISASLGAAFDEEKGYIARSYHDLDYLEHRNIVAFLYFSDLDRLYPGPNVAGVARYRDLLEFALDEFESGFGR